VGNGVVDPDEVWKVVDMVSVVEVPDVDPPVGDSVGKVVVVAVVGAEVASVGEEVGA
jgi:hypothetical protein